jgi:hypothetical protein
MAINLTVSDWQEIYYAIDTKLDCVKAGRYGSLTDAENKRWEEHLQSILEKIGVDAETAIWEGVKPLKRGG